MRDLLITLIVFSSIPVIFMRPYIGVYMWSWISYMSPHRLTWSYAYNMQFAAVIGGSLLLSLLFTKEKKNIPWNPVTITMLIWAIWMIITTIFAYKYQYAMFDFQRTMKIMLMTFVLMMLITDRDKIHKLVWVIAGSIGFFGIKGGVFVVLTGGSYRVWGPEKTFIYDNNTLALALVMIVPLLYYLYLQSKQKLIKIGLLVSIVLCAASAISSYSRGAFLAMTAMGIFLWIKGNKKLMIGAVLVVVAAGVLYFMPERWYDRIESIQNYEQDESAMGRINSWKFAFNMALHRPLGGGFGSFTRSLFNEYAPDPNDFHDAHSIYFEVLGEHGFIGLFIYLTLGFLAFRCGSWIIKNTKMHDDLHWARDLAAMIQVSLIGFAVGGAFLGLAYYDLSYNLVAILVLTRVVVEKELDLIKGSIEVPVQEDKIPKRLRGASG